MCREVKTVMGQATEHIESLIMRDLENAAMNLEKRNYYLYRTLSKYVAFTQLHALLFLRFTSDKEQTNEIIYVGAEKKTLHKWIQPLIAPSIELTIENLMNAKPPSSLGRGRINTYEHGIIVTWPEQNKTKLEPLLLEGLKAVSFVEQRENDYFYESGIPFEPDVTKSIQEKDKDGLVELLSLTKLITQSDITFWGETNSKQVEVDMHIGSRDGRFGFLLPLGKGIGGLAAQNKKVLQVADYQNCEYRYGDVSVAVDQEKIRTVFALPLKDEQKNTSGILYVGNRTINPVPLDKKFLLLRLGSRLEPIVKRKEIKQFFTNVDRNAFFKQKKAELREIAQTAKQLAIVERWLADFLKGEAVLFDPDGKPYCHKEIKFNRKKTGQFYSYPLTYNERHLGKLSIWTNVHLPLQNDWPDFIDDVIHAIYIINERNERYYHLAELERSQWLYNMMQPSMDPKVQYEKGIKLRIPIDQGEIWAIHWHKNTDILSLKEKMQLEEISLLCFREPIYFRGTSGYILFDRPTQCSPEALRNQLLQALPVKTWIIHGATYASFEDLRDMMLQLQALLESAKREKKNEYILTFENFGLENLLSNPRVAEELQAFAQHTLKPVIEYDAENDSELTKTLALSLIYKSPSKVAKKLFIHPNTVHYRVNRAKQLLNIDIKNVSNEIALVFAAYTWLFEQNMTIAQMNEDFQVNRNEEGEGIH